MKYSIKTHTAILVFLFLIITSCSSSQKDEVKIVNNNFSKSYCINNSNLCAKLIINLQTISNNHNKVIQEFINKTIENAVFSRLKDYNPNVVQKSIQDTIAVNFFREYKSFRKEIPDYKVGWEISVYDSVIFFNKNIVTVKVAGLFFTGGAHPNSFANFKTYSLNTITEPTLQHIFKPDFKNNLTQIAEAEFRKQKGLLPGTDLSKAGYWFKNNKFVLNNNWGIVKNGILFFYDDYEIAPHSMGTTTLFIPFSKIENLLANKNLLE